MNTTDNKENNIEIKTEALPAKKVSDSETHQLHVVIHPDINGFGRCSAEDCWSGSMK